MRHGKPFCTLTEEEQNEADELQNLLYLLHTTPVIDHLGISLIAKHTEEDPILLQLLHIVKSGKKWILKLHQTSYENLNLFLTKLRSQETTFY